MVASRCCAAAAVASVICTLAYYSVMYASLRDTPYSIAWTPDAVKVYQFADRREAWALKYVKRLAASGGVGVLGGRRSTDAANLSRAERPSLEDQDEFSIGVVAVEGRKGHHVLQIVSSIVHSGRQGAGRPPSSLRGAAAEESTEQIPRASLLVYVSQSSEGGDAGGGDAEALRRAGVTVLTERDSAVPGGTGWKVDRAEHADDGADKWMCKENADYARTLEACLARSKAPYVVLLEEDGWTTPRFLSKLGGVVEEVQRQEQALPEPQRGWVALKLYSSAWWAGWERDDIPLLLTAGVGTALLVFLVMYAVAICGCAPVVHAGSAAGYVRLARVAGLLLLSAQVGAAVPLTLLLAGKQGSGMTPLTRRGVWAHNIGVGTVAIVFPRAAAGALLESLAKHQCQLNTDLIVKDFRERSGKRQYIIVPSLVEHVGLRSTNSGKREARRGQTLEFIVAKNKWAGAFEDYSPAEWHEMEQAVEEAGRAR